MGQELRKVVKYFIYKSLSENLQAADKHLFNPGILNNDDKKWILSVTNGDEMTLKTSEIYEWFKKHSQDGDISLNELNAIKNFYKNLKNYNKNIFPYINFVIDKPSEDISDFWAYMKEREYCINQLKRLPDVFKRNIKSLVDINIPQQHYYYLDELRRKFKHLADYLEIIERDLEPEEYQVLINKTFNSKVLKNSWEEIFTTLQNNYTHFLNVEEPFEEVIEKANYIGAEVVESLDTNDMKYIVVKVFNPEQMQEIGCGALWCLVTNATYHWDIYTNLTEFAYVIFDYKATEKKYFKMVYCEVDSQSEEEIRSEGLRMQLWAADNQTRLDDYTLDSIGIDMDKINKQIDQAVAKKIKPKKERKIQPYQHYDKNQLNIPFDDPGYKQVAEQLRKEINKIIKPPLLGGGSSNKHNKKL